MKQIKKVLLNNNLFPCIDLEQLAFVFWEGIELLQIDKWEINVADQIQKTAFNSGYLVNSLLSSPEEHQ